MEGNMGFVRTLLKDINPMEMGCTLCHEHLVCRPPHWVWKNERDLILDDSEKTLQDVMDFKKNGGGTIVDATAIDYGRDVEAVAQIAVQSGINVIGTAGFNKSFLWDAPLDDRLLQLIGGYKCFRDWIEKTPVERLADFVQGEIDEGLEGTLYRAGQVKFGTGYNSISPLEVKTMEVVSAVHHSTGAPIHSHTEAGTMALKQIEILKGLNINLKYVSFGHMDRNLDLWYHRKIADTGAYLCFDGIGKIKYHPESILIDHIITLVKLGYQKQILISGDTARRSYYRHYGFGPGLDYAITGFKYQFSEMAKDAGLDHEALFKDFFYNNPTNCMAFKNRWDDNVQYDDDMGC
jgi:phosphotriesterase-related protein